jgi:hypothetical protein
MNERKKTALFVGYLIPDRAKEYTAVGLAYKDGYTAMLEVKNTDEEIYMIQPEDFAATIKNENSEILEKSLVDHGFEIVSIFDWMEQGGK